MSDSVAFLDTLNPISLFFPPTLTFTVLILYHAVHSGFFRAELRSALLSDCLVFSDISLQVCSPSWLSQTGSGGPIHLKVLSVSPLLLLQLSSLTVCLSIRQDGLDKKGSKVKTLTTQ